MTENEQGPNGENGVEEEVSVEDFESAMETMPQILSETLENYTAQELKDQPIRAEDVIQIMLASEIDVPESWDECDNSQKNTIIRTMQEAAQSFPGAVVRSTEEGPVITVE